MTIIVTKLSSLVFSAESELDAIVDQEVRLAVEKSPLFDHINRNPRGP